MVGAPRHAPSPRTLASRRLDLWFIDLTAPAAAVLDDVARDLGLIPAPRNDTSATPRQSTQVALRLLLAGYVGRTAARQPFDVAPGGKPSLAAALHSNVAFSLAHIETAALVAISCDGPVGVDLEAPRSVRIAEERRAALIEAAASLSPHTSLPDGPGEARFLQAWTRLEALAKATGEGIGSLLERLRRGGPPLAQTVISNRPVRVCDVTVPSAAPFYAAVAGTGTPPADAPSPAAIAFPLDPASLEHWLADGPPPEASRDQPLRQD